jgi:hypothetical protein
LVLSTIHFLNNSNIQITGITTSNIQGLYQGKSDSTGDIITLILTPDAKVILSYENDEKRPMIQTGTWKMADEKLEVMLLTNENKPYPLPIQLLFEKKGNTLNAVFSPHSQLVRM